MQCKYTTNFGFYKENHGIFYFPCTNVTGCSRFLTGNSPKSSSQPSLQRWERLLGAHMDHGVLLPEICLLSLQNSGHRFECHTEVDILSVGDTTLDAAAMVRLGRKLSVDILEHVVLL